MNGANDGLTVRERLYAIEDSLLSPYASHSRLTRGRAMPIPESDVRTEYMRDRDRIIHSKAFRRMKDKTQVFLHPSSSHYRTRLTHTMEVSQIARTISKALRLNEDLTEAIALGHDLGHTPFGHAGERAINRIIPFEHNKQSVRVVTELENNGKGLNLTFEVIDGILNHKKALKPLTLEGMSVNLSDRIAYINHDIDDAIRAGILSDEDLPSRCLEVIGHTHSERINTLICDIINESEGKNDLTMSSEVSDAFDELRQFMFDNVYTNPYAKSEEKKLNDIIEQMFGYYDKHLDQLPDYLYERLDTEGKTRCIADYISGMTDAYLLNTYEDIFIPKGWSPARTL
ncbi:MAG: deoxyguanosinetriphosphate triphosphohydrolase [Clostridia bacterium]|nr:deoxyguanosinetriphosphate triphosphohydrolase [Clostridia bacterium]